MPTHAPVATIHCVLKQACAGTLALLTGRHLGARRRPAAAAKMSTGDELLWEPTCNELCNTLLQMSDHGTYTTVHQNTGSGGSGTSGAGGAACRA